MATYNYTDGDGVTALDVSTPDGATEPVSVLDDAVRQIKAYLLDPTKGPDALVTALNSSRVGFVEDFAGSAIPAGYLLCDGSSASRTTYAALFATIGVTFGVGDGVTTFTLPDCRGRSSRGVGSGTAHGASNVTLGLLNGQESVLQTTAMVGQHAHQITDACTLSGANGAQAGTSSAIKQTSAINTSASATPTVEIPLNNPFIGFNKIIRAL